MWNSETSTQFFTIRNSFVIDTKDNLISQQKLSVTTTLMMMMISYKKQTAEKEIRATHTSKTYLMIGVLKLTIWRWNSCGRYLCSYLIIFGTTASTWNRIPPTTTMLFPIQINTYLGLSGFRSLLSSINHCLVQF